MESKVFINEIKDRKYEDTCVHDVHVTRLNCLCFIQNVKLVFIFYI